MPTGNQLEAVLFARLLFWVLLPIVLLAPRRWALLGWLAMTHLDATGPGLASNANIGWINALKSLGLPLYLCWRLRAVPSRLWHSLPARIWMLLIAYAAVAALWSSFPLSAAKIVGNMIGILLAVVVLEKFARSGALDTLALAAFVILSLGLGTVQTLVFRGTTFGFDGLDQAIRFTSFVGAQQYAALVVALLACVLWAESLSGPRRWLLAAMLGVALVWNGSRAWCLGGLGVVLIYAWLSRRRGAGHAALVAAGCVVLVLLGVNLGLLEADRYWETSSRLAATLAAAFTGEDTAASAGLRNMGFRLAMYNGVLEALDSASMPELLFGHGTSNGGLVAMTVFPRAYSIDRLDPNRVIHNEWLRALYEWGLVGFLLWGLALLGLAGGVVSCYREQGNPSPASGALAYLPALALALSTENILAGAGNAVTIGLSILLSFLWRTGAAGREKATAAWRETLAA